MADNSPGYDTGAIRELLLAAFTADELRRFCQDRADFRQVLKDVGANPSPNELADQVLTHCETQFLYDRLLAEVERLAPRQYERFAPRLLLPEAVLAEVSCPYRGLEVFHVEHAANYFGREAMVTKLLEKLGETNFVAVVGPSGCGKSSLVRAGLVPALDKGALHGSEKWQVETFLPGDDPLRALALTLVRLLMPEATPVDRLAEARKLADHLRDGTLPIADVLAQVKDQSPDNPRLVLVADQFEETFTLCNDEAQRRTFLEALLQTAEMPWVTVIFTLRADFYGRVLEDEAFGRRVDAGLVNVLPMSREERRAAVEKPALRAGRRFEEGLVERILDAVEGSPGDLPLLEFALTELWGRQRADGLLTHDAYEEIGEVRGAIATRANAALDELGSDEKQEVCAIFTRLVRVARPDEGADDTRRRVRIDELQPQAQALVKELADARLLVTGRDPASGEETVEVAHEALIRGWKPLQEWLNRDREFLLWRQRLDTLARIWEESGRGEGALLRDALLEEARVRSAGRLDELSALEHAYLEGSEAAAQQAEAARESARQRELEQAQKLAEESEARRAAEEARAHEAQAAAEAQRRSSVRLRRLVYGLVLVLSIALIAAWLAIRQGQIAKARSLITESRLQIGNQDPNLATLLALEAQKYEPSEAERILGNEIPATFDTFITSTVLLGDHGDWVRSVAWSPDGRTLASGSADNTIKLWDVARGEVVQTLRGHGVSVSSVAWSPDGRTLASGSADNTIKLWPEPYTGHPCTWVYTNLTPAQWLQFMGWSIYRPTCPALPSEPAPSIADALDGDSEYLLITWSGHIVIVAAGLVALILVGLLIWGVRHPLRSRRRLINTTVVTALMLALFAFTNAVSRFYSELPVYILALIAVVAGLTLTLLLWGSYRLGRWLLGKIFGRSGATAS